ncbi:MAG TPA: hypothetical protein VG097_08790 [Gemmata sp.]|nr:hypothetical protein [Gemmata sp.]
MKNLLWIFVLTISLCGCWKPKLLNITPRDASTDEIKHALTQLPEGFRAALPDLNPANAGRLDLHVWAFDFDGGPFDLAIETLGADSDKVSWRGEPRLRCDGERGRLLIWIQPRESAKMDPELREKFCSNKPQVPNLAIGIDTNDKSTLRMDSYGIPDKPFVPWWFGWKEVEVHESKTPLTLKVREVGSVLRIEAIEKGVANPRKVIVSFQAIN